MGPFTFTCTATSAGGIGSQSVTVKRDTDAPTLAPSVSPNQVVLNGSATATAGATDTLSGVASQSCDPVTTAAVGSASVSCSATDQAGNVGTGSASYRVVYAVTRFASPIDAPGIVNKAKAGQTVPFKFGVTDATGSSGLQHLGDGNYLFNFKNRQSLGG